MTAPASLKLKRSSAQPEGAAATLALPGDLIASSLLCCFLASAPAPKTALSYAWMLSPDATYSQSSIANLLDRSCRYDAAAPDATSRHCTCKRVSHLFHGC